MFVAHAPAGYLLGQALKPHWGSAVVPAAIAGAVVPDLDLVLWWLDPSIHHHAWPTHWPSVWLAATVIGVGLARLGWVRVLAIPFTAFALSGLLHQLLDTVVGDIRWLAPWDHGAWSLFEVERRVEPWWLNFLLHPTFAVEIGIWGVAAWRWHRMGRSRDQAADPGA